MTNLKGWDLVLRRRIYILTSVKVKRIDDNESRYGARLIS
jgi:hypothetical protein